MAFARRSLTLRAALLALATFSAGMTPALAQETATIPQAPAETPGGILDFMRRYQAVYGAATGLLNGAADVDGRLAAAAESGGDGSGLPELIEQLTKVVAEDEPKMRALLQRALAEESYAVDTAADGPQAAVFRVHDLALHQPARIKNVLLGSFGGVEQRCKEQQPAQHLAVEHGLRDVIDAFQPRFCLAIRDRPKLDVPDPAKIALGIEKIDQAAAQATNRRNLEFAGADGLPDRLTARQIEAARRAITRHMKRAGRVWIRVFPDVPVTKKPLEVRMGSGKGGIELWVTRVKPGRILFEVDGIPLQLAKEALDLAAAKLPIKTRFVQRITE